MRREMLVRGRYVIPDPSRPNAVVVDGAVLVKEDRVLAIGSFHALQEAHPDAPVIGSGEHVVMPGLINAHDHGRAVSTAQAGIADHSLEMWMVSLADLPPVDPYLAGAYAASVAIESGVTTVVNSWFEAPLARYEETLSAALAGHEDAGVRSVWALGILDQSGIAEIYRGVLPSLSPEQAERVRRDLESRRGVPADAYFRLCRDWQEEVVRRAERASILCGPVSAHWCSDTLLERLAGFSAETGLGMQTHLLETPFQAHSAKVAHGEGMVSHLARMGFLSRRLSCAHSVWVSPHDMDLLAESETSVVHCPGSNLRLTSGIAPIREMMSRGVNVALGLDSNTLHDNGDPWQEIQLAAHLHRQPGRDTLADPVEPWFAMATTNGARALMMEQEIGKLVPGAKADLILVSLDRIMMPAAVSGDDPLPLLWARGEGRDVDSVMIDGKLVMQERRLLGIDKQALAAELRDQVQAAVAQRVNGRPSLVREILPFAARLNKVATETLETPYYRHNSMED